MKKTILLTLIAIFLVVGLSAARTRAYTQKLVANGENLPDVTNPAIHAEDYIIKAWVTERPEELLSSETHPYGVIRVNYLPVPPGQEVSAAFLQFANFATDWTEGETIRFELTKISTERTITWDLVIPDNTTNSIGHMQPINPIPELDCTELFDADEPTTTFNLTVNGPTGYTVTGPNELTGDMNYTFTVEETNTLIGDWSVVEPAPEGFFWVATTIAVDADDFIEDEEDENVFNAEIEFELRAATYEYKLFVNGPEGYTVTGPGEYAGDMGDVFTSEDIDDLLGNWTASDAPEGFFWVLNPIIVVEDDFTLPAVTRAVDYVYTAEIEFELQQLPDTYEYILTVLGPEGYTVTGPGEYAGDMGDVFTNEDMEELLGDWTASDAPDGFSWEVNPIVVTEGHFALPGEKAHIVYNGEIEFVLVQDPPEPDTYHYQVRVAYDTSEVEPPAPPAPFNIWVPAAATGETGEYTETDATFWRNEDVTRLVGRYTPIVPEHANPLCTYYWEPEYVEVTVESFEELEGGFHTKAHYDMEAFYTFVLREICDIPPTTPVELSSFTAVVTGGYVKLNWVTQTETGMIGYRVYRNTTESQEDAMMITPIMIPATNTSSTQTYVFEDREVDNGTYWYWLESVDYNSSNFHGPTTVIVQGEIIPELPNISELKNAYPNPFKVSASTNIEVDIKAGEIGTVTIYNILGQAVKTYTVNAGQHKLNWNGRDSRGNSVGSGIYFYKLSTPSANQTKKMVIVK